jgi:hypothetical protein
MLPEQKTDQNNETFEHAWQWFLNAPEHKKVWLVEMHKPKRAIGTILFVTFETLKTYENENNAIQTRASGKPTEMPDASRTENISKKWNLWTRMAMVFEGSRTRESLACWDAQTQRATGSILFVKLETLKTYQNVNNVIQTRASGKPTEMPRCFRNRNLIKTMKLLKTNGNGFW